ncbi:MAG: HupE/UreJ family protein [Deltaproteobacteria bacterium]|nr:HupE/UreJ family protein [Deltaproteobacteria bacterium]
MIRRPFVFAVALLLCSAVGAQAHSFDPIVLDIRESAAGIFDLRWQLALAGEGFESANASIELPPHCQTLALDQERPARIDCGERGLRGQTLRLPAPALALARTDVLLRMRFRDGESAGAVLSRSTPSFVVPGVALADGARSTLLLAGGYVRLGIDHILGGPDHLLFVLGLILLVAGWRRLLATLTAFTLAHSLTLALAIFDVVRVPAGPVEASIALSIVLLAAELTHDPTAPSTLARRAPWSIAFVFGLLHGLGFAGALREVGLPATQIPLALVSFNLGVEIGQLCFVAAALLPVLAWRRLSTKRPALALLPAYAIGSVAVVWVLQRLAVIF